MEGVQKGPVLVETFFTRDRPSPTKNGIRPATTSTPKEPGRPKPTPIRDIPLNNYWNRTTLPLQAGSTGGGGLCPLPPIPDSNARGLPGATNGTAPAPHPQDTPAHGSPAPHDATAPPPPPGPTCTAPAPRGAAIIPWGPASAAPAPRGATTWAHVPCPMSHVPIPLPRPTAPRFPLPTPPIRVPHPQPPPAPLQDPKLGAHPPTPREAPLVVRPRPAGAQPLREVGRGNRQARAAPTSPHLRGLSCPLPLQPRPHHPGARNAADGMGNTPPGRGSGPPHPPHPRKKLAPHRPHHHPTSRARERERAKGRHQAGGRGKDHGDARAPTETGHRGQHITGTRNHRRDTNTGRGEGQEQQHWGKGRPRGRAPGHTPTERRCATPEGLTLPKPHALSNHHETRRDTATQGCRPKRQTTPETHTHQDAPPQPRPNNARTTPGHARQPPQPRGGEGGTPTQLTTESTSQATTATSKPGDHPNHPPQQQQANRHEDTGSEGEKGTGTQHQGRGTTRTRGDGK